MSTWVSQSNITIIASIFAGLAQRLERSGAPFYRTDERGVIEIVSDGTRLWVETER